MDKFVIFSQASGQTWCISLIALENAEILIISEMFVIVNKLILSFKLLHFRILFKLLSDLIYNSFKCISTMNSRISTLDCS